MHHALACTARSSPVPCRAFEQTCSHSLSNTGKQRAEIRQIADNRNRLLRQFYRGSSSFRRDPFHLVCTMSFRSTISKLRQTLDGFGRAQAGNVAITFALATLPVIGTVGAAVDYSHANSVKVAMQAALDSTALMLSKEAATDSSAQLQTNALKYFNALFTRPEATSCFGHRGLHDHRRFGGGRQRLGPGADGVHGRDGLQIDHRRRLVDGEMGLDAAARRAGARQHRFDGRRRQDDGAQERDQEPAERSSRRPPAPTATSMSRSSRSPRTSMSARATTIRTGSTGPTGIRPTRPAAAAAGAVAARRQRLGLAAIRTAAPPTTTPGTAASPTATRLRCLAPLTTTNQSADQSGSEQAGFAVPGRAVRQLPRGDDGPELRLDGDEHAGRLDAAQR